MRPSVALALLAFPASVAAAPLTVYVGESAADLDVRAAFTGFVGALAKDRPDVAIAIATCAENSAPGSERSRPSADHGRGCGDADALMRVLDGLDPAHARTTRIAVFGGVGATLATGRHTAEMVARRAEHLGVIIDVMEVAVAPDPLALGALTPVVEDVRRFLSAPTAPSPGPGYPGRVATQITGGRFELVVLERPRPPVDRRLERDRIQRERYAKKRGLVLEPPPPSPAELREQAAIDALRALESSAYARQVGERDGLDDLADGTLRPSEVPVERVPLALHGVDLEPLLDAVFELVEARAQLGHLVDALARRRSSSAEDAGRAMAAGIERRARWVPSRR